MDEWVSPLLLVNRMRVFTIKRGSEPLIYSQWGWGRKALPGEGLRKMVDGKNLF
jgi:hypothetical protein